MGIVRRLYTITPPPGIELEKIFERLSEELRTSYAEISFRQGKIYLQLVGTEASIKETWMRVRNVVNELWGLYRLRTAGEAPIDVIVREASRTFPPESLVYALEIRGYKAEYDKENNLLRTNAPSDLVIGLARRIAEVIDELAFRVKGTAIKRLIATVAVGLNVDVDKVIEFGLKMRVFEKSEDGKIVLREEWHRALRKLVVMLKPHSGVNMSEKDSSET